MNTSPDTHDYLQTGLYLRDLIPLFADDVFTFFDKFGIDFYYYLIRYFEVGTCDCEQVFFYDLILDVICTHLKLDKRITLLNLDSDKMFFQYFEDFKLIDNPEAKSNLADVLSTPIYISIPKNFTKVRKFNIIYSDAVSDKDKKSILTTVDYSIDDPQLKFFHLRTISSSLKELKHHVINWNKIATPELTTHKRLVQLHEQHPNNLIIKKKLIDSANEIFLENKKQSYAEYNIKKEKIEIDVEEEVNNDSQKTIEIISDDEESEEEIKEIKEIMILNKRQRQQWMETKKRAFSPETKKLKQQPKIIKEDGLWIVYISANEQEYFDNEIEANLFLNNLAEK